MNLRKAFIGSAMVGAMVVGSVATQAATFASFSFAGPSRFDLLPGGVFTVTTNVSFRYVGSGINGVTAPPSMVNQDYAATFSMLGSLVPGTGTHILPTGSINQAVTITAFSFIGNQFPVGGGNLLSGVMSKGNMSGQLGATTAGLNFSTEGPSGGPIVFTSDYLGFQPGTRGATFGLSDIINAAGGSGLGFTGFNIVPFLLDIGNIDPFNSSIAGSFDAEPRPGVPEPGSIAMLIGFGVAGTAMFVRRRK